MLEGGGTTRRTYRENGYDRGVRGQASRTSGLMLVATLACGADDEPATDETSGASKTGAGETSSPDPTGAEGTGDDDRGTADESTDTGDAPVCGDPIPWLEESASAQVEAMVAGELCCLDLALAYLDRIDTDRTVNAVIAIDDATEDAAAMLDTTVAGPLHCATVLVKDNIDVAAMATTAGSLAMVDNVVATDAPAIAGLRAAGALIVGKANLSEWANFRGQSSTSGWSSVGGQTHNGADPARNPCGSSSGSAAAVAAGLVAASIGTETSGSIVCPSSVNGVVGLKPTVGLVSRTGVVPLSHTFDTTGPITQTVADAALLLSAMAGPDPLDPATDAIPPGLDLDFVAALDGVTLQGARIGTSLPFAAQFGAEEQALYQTRLDALQSAGATLVPIDMPNAGGNLVTVLTTELKVDLNAYLADHAAPGVPETLADVIAFNDDNAETVLVHFGQQWLVAAEATTGLDDPGYIAAVQQLVQSAGEDGLLPVLDDDDLDAIVVPTTGPAWITNYATGDAGTPSSAFLPAAARYPHLTVPMGEVAGLPVGLSFIGRPFEDATILALGHAFEQL